MTEKRTVMFLSDRTGITAETLGHSLLTQFDSFEFTQRTVPFINSVEKARATVESIDRAARDSGRRPIIFSTTVSDEIRDILRTGNGLFLDFFDTFIDPIERELEVKSSHTAGRAHGMDNRPQYESRIEAINYALSHDDGVSTKSYEHADVILIAPSRCGKTPTCLYMALQHGVRAANYPLTEDDLENTHLPDVLIPFRKKLYGLTIEAERLQQIRNERRPGSRYASLAQCAYELRQAQQLYRRDRVPCIDTTNVSVEEIATLIMDEKGVQRRSF